MSSTWPWHFITVSEEEKSQRRDLLDLRGVIAQGSILVVIIVLRVYQAWATAQIPGDAPKPRRGLTSWWDRPLVTGWLETRRQYLVCGVWLSWLVGLAVWKSGDDYLHLTKALGHIGLSQVPLQVLMSPAAYISTTKPSAGSIFSFITSISQATITPYHRLFGRVVISPLLFGHASLYLLFFVQSSHPEFGSLLSKRVRDFDVQCGLLALSTAVSLLFFVRPRGVARKSGTQPATSMQERRRSFYIGHVLLVTILCAAVYCHVTQAQRYMLQALGASVINGVCSLVLVRWGG
ncbi:Phenylalanine--tRNA ligase beta subunit [Penicillium atrosanguineum]|uniref:Ferric oxidoreductase domain-containing protein n=1 Tax=Penicillium atrosanguineum TaxID=1132637 RepID=A0A9W9PYQ2_9EURO|nr:Phenylalanine--tRNA ligase beta subunit [Penicillium atrosanguineum]KAJ5122083.1 hypothetical protein N7526_009020 [Penicillium atrosanguineum]KAJ5309726.1 Phenylalanine--tRNA ligase beta subunit [Penicillium atrosanguineum]KAJ5315248.1 hypothetical protein N7476_005555 [Penicillium atrosanguineum]